MQDDNTVMENESAELEPIAEAMMDIEDIRDILDAHSIEINAIRASTSEMITLLRTLVDLMRSEGGVSSRPSSPDVEDMMTVIATQRKIIRTFLTTPELGATAKAAVAQRLADMPEWTAMESAEQRLAEREAKRKSIESIVGSATKEAPVDPSI